MKPGYITEVHWSRALDRLICHENYSLVYENKAVVLIPAKITKVIENLKSSSYQVQGAVIFNTCRQTDSQEYIGEKYDEEPVANGKILAQWIGNTFSLAIAADESYGIGKSGWINILSGKMQIADTKRSYPVNRQVIENVDSLFKTLKQCQPGMYLCLIDSGGIPVFKEHIKECAAYRFNRKVLHWIIQEKEEHFDLSESIPPPPAESFKARYHARELIRKGDFTGAYSAVQYLEYDEIEKEWILALKNVSEYFLGILKTVDAIPAYLKQLTNNKPRCLLAAIRTEASLQAGRLPDAISWTSTFFDAAVLDCLEQNPHVEKINDFITRIWFKEGFVPPENLLSSEALYAKSRTQNSYMYNIMGKKINTWLDFLQSDSLSDYNRILMKEPVAGLPSPKKYRNLTLHSMLDANTMQQTYNVFNQSGLWNSVKECKFLTQPLVANVLTELGIDIPAALYNDLVEGLIKTLDDHIIK